MKRSAHSEQIGRLATQALIDEASLWPKPGLVTPFGRGAHPDMDFSLFVRSARALESCFAACAAAGATVSGDKEELFARLRKIGRAGEAAMWRATDGVNTHKGAIFCLGLLSAGLGSLTAGRASAHGARMLGDAVCAFAARLTRGLVDRELSRMAAVRTSGERLYILHGARGARGQAEDGYPVLTRWILPILREGQGGGAEAFRRSCHEALLTGMAHLEDSCLLARGGVDGLRFTARQAAAVLSLPVHRRVEGLQRLDAELCARRLSPGGSADLLAAGFLLVAAERLLGTPAISADTAARIA